MTRARAIAVGLLVATAIATALVVGLARGDSVPDDSVARRLRAQATLEPRIVLFGDTVRARVDVTFDRRRIDPDSLKVRASFKEWRRVGRSEVVRSDAGSSTHLRVTYVLRCLRQDCPPERELRPFEFDPAEITFVRLDGESPTTSSVEAFWPRLIVNTRISPGDLVAGPSPLRAELATVPVPSYRASPGLLIVLLVAGAGLLVILGGLLTVLGWPRRAPAPTAEPAPGPDLSLTPLEQALELLEDAARANGIEAQRRSLELVADVLAQRGDADGLAPAARELAWSPIAPPPEATQGLAVRVRARLDEELRRLESERRRREAAAAAAVMAREAHARRS